MANRVTQAPVQALVKPDTTKMRVTQAPVQALVKPDTTKMRVTQMVVQVLIGTAVASPTAHAFAYAQFIE